MKFFTSLSRRPAAVLAALSMLPAAMAQQTVEPVELNGKMYDIDVISRREIGPGTTWWRLRIPAYPLNVNILTMDVTNPYAKLEVMQAYETTGRTEPIAAAATRLSSPGHQVMAGANGNFWCVANQAPWSDLLISTPFGGTVRNGKIITETNNNADQWCGGPSATCVIASDNKRMWIEPMLWQGTVRSERVGNVPILQANKVVRAGEVGLYNSFYPETKAFQPVNQEGTHYVIAPGVSTEVHLTVDAGQTWNVGGDMTATVQKVVPNDGRGTRGTSDMVLVAHGGEWRDKLATLQPGDKMTLNHGWTSYRTSETPRLDNLMQGLSLVMHEGVIDPATNQGNSYNNQVYPKSAYGSSADMKTLYVITIDKSNDPVYGPSAGCPSHVMCAIMRHFGCSEAATVDAGGSTEMMVDGKVVNVTTEATPRPIANGGFLINLAPEDNKIARIEFEDYALHAPIYSTSAPRILGYNQYGTLINPDVQGVTLSCAPEAGSCSNNAYTATGTPGTYTLTATLDGVTVSKPVTVSAEKPSIRIKPGIVIDGHREYPVEVTATIGRNTYSYSPSAITWTLADNSVASISADGVLRGVANGTTTLRAAIGDLTDETNVTVQIPAENRISPCAQYSDQTWKTVTTGVTVSKREAAGNRGGVNITYNVTSTRGTKLGLAPQTGVEIPFYSLPDAVELVFNPGTTGISAIEVKVQPANEDREVVVKVTPTITPNADNTVTVDMKQFGDPNDLAFYPAQFRGVTFYLAGSTGTGKQMKIASMQGVYNKIGTGVENIECGQEWQGAPQLFNLQGQPVNTPNPTPGIYLRRNGNTTTKVVIK